MRFARLLLAAALFACPGFAQQDTTTPVNPTPRRNTPSTGLSLPGSDQQSRTGRLPGGLGASGPVSGRIMPAPGTRLRVDLYAGSVTMGTTFTEPDGTFRFPPNIPRQRYEVHIELGPNAEYVQDVDFAGSFSTTIQIDETNIRKRGGAAGGPPTVSLASMMVPKKAVRELEKARRLERKNKPEEALQRLKLATELYPKYAEAYTEIGMIERRRVHHEDAAKAFEQAIAADPSWIGAYANLASLQFDMRRLRQLAQTSDQMIKLDPSFAFGHFYSAVASFSAGKLDLAEKSGLEAERRDRARTPQIQLLLARIYQAKGNVAQYISRLRECLKESPKAANAPQLRAELTRAEQRHVAEARH